ncbi:MAG: serine hydroxymethyltransferase, partial [Thermotoga sp.]
ASQLLYRAGIITNMNMIPGDKDPLNPSGIRLGTQELTRIGMKESEMEVVADFMKRVLIDKEDPKKIKEEIKEFRKDYQKVHYCFHEGFDGYAYHKLV